MDEKKLNNNHYKVSFWPRTFMYLLFLLSVFSAPSMFKDKQYILSSISTICGIGCLVIAMRSNFTEIIVKNDEIIKLYKYPARSYKIKFNEITMIVDDDMSTFGLDLHVFHLIPKKDVKKNFRRFTIHGGIKNRKQLLSEIILRVGPNTYIEDAVYQYIGKGSSKTITK